MLLLAESHHDPVRPKLGFCASFALKAWWTDAGVVGFYFGTAAFRQLVWRMDNSGVIQSMWFIFLRYRSTDYCCY